MKYVGIRSEGGLIPYDTLDQIAQESVEGQKASSFGLTGSRRLGDEISRAWSEAQNHWNNFKLRREDPGKDDPYGTTLTRRRWITRLLEDCLDYAVVAYPTGPVVNGKIYAISHHAGDNEDAPAVHIEGFRVELDQRQETRRLSAHALVQQYLNVREGQLWGVVTNGLRFRLLRQATRSSKPSYVEFDLENILEENRFNEFTVFYRLCHRTRLPKGPDDAARCLLEKYFQLAIDQGGRVRDHLRDGVERALITLGTGFLQHSANADLLGRVESGALTPAEFHRQLLRLVYRLLFLMVAEERRMILPEEPESDLRWKLYDEYYSVGRLRRLCERIVDPSDYCDLWEGLKKTFALYEDGTPGNALGIPPLNGDLFGPLAIRDLTPTRLKNDDLLVAIRELSLFANGGSKQRINYSALDVEELGSVYESLLDFQPVFVDDDGCYRFELRTGSERKSTGSYYTRPELVRELIESALVPVMEERLARAIDKDQEKQKLQQQQAILSMTVCDPACGSGHFLLAAARRLGRELAKIRTDEEEPGVKPYHEAVRDVISHCIYGVDLNPLAVDLCKLALWLEGHWTGKPLSFLDHHIKCGNSLIGVLDPRVLEEGIPDEAFTPVTGDDKEVAKAFKKRNKEERKGQYLPVAGLERDIRAFAVTTHDLDGIVEDTPADVKRKQEMYDAWRNRPDWWHDWTTSNIWTAAFFVPLTRFDDPAVPTHDRFSNFIEKRDSQVQMAAAANALAAQLRFFHWHLEFPQVFAKGGFDVMLGNPPWERVKLQEEEHWIDVPYVASAQTKAERARRIDELRNSDDSSKQDRVRVFELAKRSLDAQSGFIRHSGRLPLTATGEINTFAVFSELGKTLIGPNGRVGIIVPSAIATGDTTSEFFSSLAASGCLISLKDFQEARDFFVGLESRDPFCLLTFTGSEGASDRPIQFVFQMLSLSELTERDRLVSLSKSDFSLLNPNTKNCPIFRTGRDADLTRKMYRSGPVIMDESSGLNPWSLEFLRMFDMAGDSELFHPTRKDGLLPLYESKMIHQYDHRWQTFQDSAFRYCNDDEKADPTFTVSPRHWVDAKEVKLRCSWVPPALIKAMRKDDEDDVRKVLRSWAAEYRNLTLAIDGDLCFPKANVATGNKFREFPLSQVHLDLIDSNISALAVAWQIVEEHCPTWLMAIRRFARSNDERTIISACLRFVATGDNMIVLQLPRFTNELMSFCLIANVNSIVFDFVARQKLGSANVNYFVLKQLPIVSPALYTRDDIQFITDCVANLLAVANELKAVAQAVQSEPREVKWNGEHRAVLRAELDAYYAHLYGLTRDELRYILDPKDVFGEDFPSETFRVLKEREIKEYGEYRTQRLVLEAFDKLADTPRFRDEVPKRVSAFEVPAKFSSASGR